jgi:hypothetical protein
MCTDGLIIRQPCSRVAVRRCVEQKHTMTAELKICPDSGTLNGYSQYEVCFVGASYLVISFGCAVVGRQGCDVYRRALAGSRLQRRCAAAPTARKAALCGM